MMCVIQDTKELQRDYQEAYKKVQELVKRASHVERVDKYLVEEYKKREAATDAR